MIIAGTYGKVFKPFKLIEGSERTRFLGYIEEEDLAGLYAGASLFVLPSFDEGFGLPVLEAMACGTPVIVSNGGGLCEVIGDAGVVFDLKEPRGLSNAISQALNDNSLRATLKEKGLSRAQSFTWRRTAELVWEALHEI